MKATRARNRRWEDVDKDSIELRELIRHFELYNRTEGKSQKTVDWYNVTLRQLQAFLVGSKKTTELSGLGEAEVREFILHLQQRRRYQDNSYVLAQRGKLAAISIQTYVRALRAFFNWLYREGYTNENRLANLRPPKAPTKVVEVLSPEEIARVLACIDRNTTGGTRDYAIVLLLLDSGLRCSELTGMEVDDVNLEGGYLKVMGKGGKERIVPFGASAQRALLRYLLHFRPEPFNPAIQNFFLTLDGRPLTQNTVKLIFQRIAKRSGVRRLHPHLCRHTFATNYLINGGDVFSLQQILGHTTLEMVRRYVTLASAHVTVQHRKFSPMDRISLPRVDTFHTRSRPRRTTRVSASQRG
ncbi:MAG: tyrosine-type recombinase/integrase [Thermodesulfobacteriota bacterium]